MRMAESLPENCYMVKTRPPESSAGTHLPIFNQVGIESQAEGNQIACDTIRDLREVENLRQLWKSWQETRDADIDFFTGMVRSRGADCRPHVIVLSRNGRPDAMLVGLKDRRTIPFRLCSIMMFQPEVNAIEFVRGGLLGNASTENCKALFQAVMSSLTEGDADMALWEQLDVESSLYTCAVQLPSLVSRDYCHNLNAHWSMDFPKGLEAFFRSLKRSQRYKLRRKYKQALNRFGGKMQVRAFRTTAELEQVIREMDVISRQSVKRQLGFGFFDTPQTREQLSVEAVQGWLRIYVLYIEGKPVSFWKGTLYKRCLQADYAGFDSAWSAFSPGVVLFLNILENLRDEEVETIDFGCRNVQLCHCFGKVQRMRAHVQIYAPKLSALRLNLLYTLTYYATVLIQRTRCLNWARKAVWKIRKASALARISLNQSSSGSPPQWRSGSCTDGHVGQNLQKETKC
jgi:hypothetical protein